MSSISNTPLCLEQIGFNRVDLKSLGVDEVRPYADWSNLRTNVLRGKSWRLTRYYQANSTNTIVPLYRIFNELDVLGSLEQPLVLEKGIGGTNGRGLICFCYGRRFVNATVRKSEKSGIEGYSAKFIKNFSATKDNPVKIIEKDSELEILDEENKNKVIGNIKYSIKNSFSADKSYSEFYHSVHDTCEKLYSMIAPFKGLIVVSGGTGSGKSQIVRGLINKFIEEKLEEAGKNEINNLKDFNDRMEKYRADPSVIGKPLRRFSKRTHLLTVENPVEKYLFESIEDGSPLPPNILAQLIGLDYTPRQAPEDTPSLEQALMRDALRQTPTLTYVGEVREPQEFRTVLDFAETGHCVITTMHAGSLREAFLRFLSTASADTPSSRAQIASRICAVIHLQPLNTEIACGFATSQERRNLRLALPAVWKNTSTAVSNLVADGLSSLIPNAVLEPRESAYCFGRTHFLTPHRFDVDKLEDVPLEDSRPFILPPSDGEISSWERARQEAVALDMGRGKIIPKVTAINSKKE